MSKPAPKPVGKITPRVAPQAAARAVEAPLDPPPEKGSLGTLGMFLGTLTGMNAF